MTLVKHIFAFAIAILLSANLQAATTEADGGPVEGTHYKLILPAQPSAAPEGKVEIIELFWYGCSHCFTFEPYIKSWLKNKDENIVFTRMPAPLNPKWEPHTRFYYAAEALGVLDKLHEPLFVALHEKKQRIYTEKSLIDFAAAQGVDREKFTAAYRSFSVSSKVQRARKLGKAYGPRGVPAVVIDGKYRTSGSDAGSLEGVIYLMDLLAKKELALKTSVAKAENK